MSHGNLSRSQICSSSNYRNFGCSMMYRSERSFGYQRVFFIQFSHQRIYLRNFQDFIKIQRRQNSAYSFSQYRFSASRCSNHQHVMQASSSNAQCPFCKKMSFDIFKIHLIRIFRSNIQIKISSYYLFNIFCFGQMSLHLLKIFQRIYIYSFDISEFIQIFCRNKEIFVSH